MTKKIIKIALFLCNLHSENVRTPSKLKLPIIGITVGGCGILAALGGLGLWMRNRRTANMTPDPSPSQNPKAQPEKESEAPTTARDTPNTSAPESPSPLVTPTQSEEIIKVDENFWNYEKLTEGQLKPIFQSSKTGESVEQDREGRINAQVKEITDDIYKEIDTFAKALQKKMEEYPATSINEKNACIKLWDAYKKHTKLLYKFLEYCTLNICSDYLEPQSPGRGTLNHLFAIDSFKDIANMDKVALDAMRAKLEKYIQTMSEHCINPLEAEENKTIIAENQGFFQRWKRLQNDPNIVITRLNRFKLYRCIINCLKDKSRFTTNGVKDTNESGDEYDSPNDNGFLGDLGDFLSQLPSNTSDIDDLINPDCGLLNLASKPNTKRKLERLNGRYYIVSDDELWLRLLMHMRALRYPDNPTSALFSLFTDPSSDKEPTDFVKYCSKFVRNKGFRDLTFLDNNTEKNLTEACNKVKLFGTFLRTLEQTIVSTVSQTSSNPLTLEAKKQVINMINVRQHCIYDNEFINLIAQASPNGTISKSIEALVNEMLPKTQLTNPTPEQNSYQDNHNATLSADLDKIIQWLHQSPRQTPSSEVSEILKRLYIDPNMFNTQSNTMNHTCAQDDYDI